MIEEEKQELYKMICGSSLFGHECGQRGGRLIYDGTMFRCCNQPSCWRVTPQTGKLTKHYWMEQRYVGDRYVDNKIDPLKRSLVNKRIKQLKDAPELSAMKLVKRDGGTIWVEIDGQLIHPKKFMHRWWMFKWERDF